MIEQDTGDVSPAPEADVPAAPEQTQEAPPPDESGAQAEGEQPKKADIPPVQKRIDQLTWQKHEAERRLNAEIMRRAEAEQQAQRLYEQQQELMRLATMPTMDQVGLDPDAYQRAVREHNERFLQQQRQAQYEAQSRQQQVADRMQFEQVLNQRIAEGVQKYPDYNEVVGNPSLPPLQSVNPALLGAILGHESMPELTYYLGKNPAEAHRIAALPPARAILEVGKIAAKLPMPTNKSNAPPPPAQVSGTTGTVQRDPSKMSYDEFVKWRRNSIAQRR
jgi:hypothetical protein